MVYACSKVELGRLERVVGREPDVEEEHAAGEGGVLWALYGRVPVVRVLIVNRAGHDVVKWVLAKINEIFLNSMESVRKPLPLGP